jgi:serine protease Do
VVRNVARWALSGVLLAAAAAGPVAPLAAQAPADPQSTALTEASGSAQRIYARAKPHLLQIRTLTAASRSQAGVGSGFAIGDGATVITNYHVIARLALEPERYVGEAVDTGGERSEFTIRAIDVRNDLAVLDVKRPGARGALAAAASALEQGQRLFSLGNPLDLGFAISEGRFNGVLKRPYYEHILFSGALNPGMSGGPALDDAGRVVGVNVARRLDGELISFLVPVHYVQALLDRTAGSPAPAAELRKEISRQLTDHQVLMAEHLQANPFTTRALGPYRAPVNESRGVRCWGSSPAMLEKPYRVDRLDCRMEFALFVEDILRVGYIQLRHEYIQAKGLDALRFSKLYSRSFKNEGFGSHRDKRMTGPQCTESFVRHAGGPGEFETPPLRAVLCVRALRKFDELYEFALLTATVDDGKAGLQSRIDVSGVTYETGLAITRAFLQAIGREPQ